MALAVIMLIGMAATVAMSIVLWQLKARDRSILPWIVVGLLAMFIWPISLWVAIGLWWYWRGRSVPPAGGAYQQVSQRGARGPLITVACAFSSLITIFLLAALVPPQEQSNQAKPAVVTDVPSSVSQAPSASQTPPAPLVQDAVVSEIVDADRVKVQIVGKAAQVVRLAGVRSPVLGADPECWGAEAKAFAEQALLGKAVRIQLDPAAEAGSQVEQTAVVFVPGGANYSVLALEQGQARLSAQGAPAELIAEFARAEADGRVAQRGVWGAPCFGAIRLAPPPSPAPVPSPASAPSPEPSPVPEPRRAQPKPAPKPEPEPAPEVEERPAAAYYPNCSAARAAGVAPLHRGEPGYSSKLDRDGDGIACET
ncbi:thermonuclease family protein [Saccharopolyspora phatthalungensis]|uniref:Endonuclease YncB(Thermonuclease family) n=1 Tax=Saccharopolyspora phatthalungensis TaxID=664693 RepID=A0A840Q260_9PSEU|nr:excalibur calcium-binding domain-containing protein [Saccharopolyspora phatthalungensis]MBB5154087.1 endonuclease YncB(thermonuclease family) [Saccharopolyspora phatthalungensis]